MTSEYTRLFELGGEDVFNFSRRHGWREFLEKLNLRHASSRGTLSLPCPVCSGDSGTVRLLVASEIDAFGRCPHCGILSQFDVFNRVAGPTDLLGLERVFGPECLNRLPLPTWEVHPSVKIS